MSTDVIGEALRELVLDRKTQDSKKRLFFCFYQAHEFSTASVHTRQAKLLVPRNALDICELTRSLI